MQLEPREYFTIVRQIENHNDTNTYYVRAVIRNSRTDEVLDTVDLVNQGNQRFTKAWQVPADTSGEGFYIDITTSVYTDSGYTSKSPNYGDDSITYLVQKRHSPSLGAGGYAFTPNQMREIVRTEVEKIVLEKTDIKPILKKVEEIEKNIQKSFKKVELSEPKKEILSEFNKLKGEITQEIKNLPEPKNYTSEIKSIESQIKNLPQPERNSQMIKELFGQMVDVLTSYRNKFRNIEKNMENLAQKVEDYNKKVEGRKEPSKMEIRAGKLVYNR